LPNLSMNFLTSCVQRKGTTLQNVLILKQVLFIWIKM